MTELQVIIEAAFERLHQLTPASAEQRLRDAVSQTVALVDCGKLRVVEKVTGEWVVHHWLKKALLLSQHLHGAEPINSGELCYRDSFPQKYSPHSESDIAHEGIHVMAPAAIRQGAYIGPNTTLLPSFVDIGAFIDENCQIGAWSTVGSCAQIGKKVQLSDRVVIAGAIALQDKPTVIEDNCFIGIGCAIGPGVVVEQGAVIAGGVNIDQSSRIYVRETGEILHGRIPAGSIVVSGTLPSSCGKYCLTAAIIVKKVDAETRARVGVSALLRSAS